MRRAIVLYVEDKINLLIQTWGLYSSWKYIQSNDTDLIFFGPKQALRKLPNDLRVIKIPQNPITVIDPAFGDYYYINSVACLNGVNSEILDSYDIILRSDTDTFLTPAWLNFYPEKYSVGVGGYSNSDEIRQNMARISLLFNINYVEHNRNIGSTHYGPTQQIKKIAKLQTDITRYLISEKFKNGEGAWPYWYRGVSLLYAGDIAVNYFIGKDLLYGSFDFFSTSAELTNKHPHIHCWHTRDRFSKFDLLDGNYDNININTLNLSIIKDYCLFMGLKGKADFQQHIRTLKD